MKPDAARWGHFRRRLWVGAVLALAATGTVSADSFKVLKSFGGSDGAVAPLGLVVGTNTIYFTTDRPDLGTVASVLTNGSGYTLLTTFADTNGFSPGATLILSGGALYGTTAFGGAYEDGVVFKLNVDGSGFSLLHAFNGTSVPSGLLLAEGVLYGTTLRSGILFRLNTDGSGYGTVCSFPSSSPTGGVVYASGKLYGNLSDGSMFSIATNASFYNGFKAYNPYDGSLPTALVLSGGTLYGTTAQAGSGGGGTVFKVNPDGSGDAPIKIFSGPDGYSAQSLVLVGGTLYGTTSQGGSSGSGVLFRLNPDGTAYTVIKNFGGSDGSSPRGPLAVSGNTLYGLTAGGGDYGAGVLFRLDLGPTPPGILVPPQSAVLAQGATASFNVQVSNLDPAVDPVAYQWVFDSTNLLAGATNSVLSLTNVLVAQAGTYAVVVTNTLGAITSTLAELTVMPIPPGIAWPAQDQVAAVGDTVSFSVQVTNQAPVVYQWVVNQTNALSGATNSSLVLANVQVAQAGRYSVIVTNLSGAVTSPPATLVVVPLGTTPVAYPAASALRAALAGPGPVTFACDGTFTVTNTLWISANSVVDGTGHQVTISGGGTARPFSVATNSALSLVNVTLTAGFSAAGAVLLNQGGTVTLVGVTVSNNQVSAAAAGGADLLGGAVYNSWGTVHATNCLFANNWAGQATASTGPPCGGALVNEQGAVTLSQCVFLNNDVTGAGGVMGSPPTGGGDGNGGAVYNSGTLVASACTFLGNVASGGSGAVGNSASAGTPEDGASGGNGCGGAICNGAKLLLDRSLLAYNVASGGGGGAGGSSTYIGYLSFSPFGGAGGNGGGGEGGTVYTYNSGVSTLVNCTLAFNVAQGGPGGTGGNAGTGWYSPHGALIGFVGGMGGRGGAAYGGLAGPGALAVTNGTLAMNSGAAGPGGAGGAGSQGSPNGGMGASGAAYGGLQQGALVNTLLATNLPGLSGSNAVVDLGHNLSSDTNYAFVAPGSLNNVDPKLGPLANNGGPTLTMALLPGSPAIDAGDSLSAPTTDQRNHPRPVGPAADIGAYEYGTTPRLRISPPSGGNVPILLYDWLGSSARLFTSASLANWQCVATNTMGADGTTLFQDSYRSGPLQRLYRVAAP